MYACTLIWEMQLGRHWASSACDGVIARKTTWVPVCAYCLDDQDNSTDSIGRVDHAVSLTDQHSATSAFLHFIYTAASSLYDAMPKFNTRNVAKYRNAVKWWQQNSEIIRQLKVKLSEKKQKYFVVCYPNISRAHYIHYYCRSDRSVAITVWSWGNMLGSAILSLDRVIINCYRQTIAIKRLASTCNSIMGLNHIF